MTRHPLPRRVGLAACALWLIGAALAGLTGVLSLFHSKPGYGAAVVTAGDGG
jgi:hypothetical protein